jgi:hypothetical protein
MLVVLCVFTHIPNVYMGLLPMSDWGFKEIPFARISMKENGSCSSERVGTTYCIGFMAIRYCPRK